MTQKGALFKGQKKKEAAANRHGKALSIKKGKLQKAPKNKTDEYLGSKEVTKFINKANEMKAATLAANSGTQFKMLKVAATESTAQAGKPKKTKK